MYPIPAPNTRCEALLPAGEHSSESCASCDRGYARSKMTRILRTVVALLGVAVLVGLFALASAALILAMAATMSHWEPLVRPFAEPLGPIAYEYDSAYIAGSWSLTRF